MNTLSSIYYDRLIGHAGASFANLVQTGERIEDGLKTEKIKDYQTLFEQSPRGTGGSIKKNVSTSRSRNDEKEVHTIESHTSRHQHHLVYPAPLYHVSAPPHDTMPHIIINLSTALNNHTHLIGPTISDNRIASRITLSEAQTKSSGTSPLCLNHCRKYTRSC